MANRPSSTTVHRGSRSVEAERARPPHYSIVRGMTRGPGRSPGGGRAEVYRTELRGFHQVPPVLSPAVGSFQAQVVDNNQAIRYELTFTELSTPPTAAHLHFGHRTDNGGIIAFLCGGDDKPACPDEGGTVAGTIGPEDILPIPDQGLEAGDMAGVLRMLRAGLVYVNVHSTAFPDGEIRGQLRHDR